MKNLNQTAEELFAKIRGRFPGVTIGDEAGNVTQEPSAARFFEFPFREGAEEGGKISITLSEDDGVVVMYNQDIAENDVFKSKWYDFLKELRQFAKKRMLNFETRDITKSNLQRRDYQYLANRSEESKMNESKMYGTSRVSYQNVDGARLVIKHTESINQESATGRTQKIGKIYIESADGERFMYPYKHLTGARAMARHVAEGGKPYDDFGSHIVGLSEELAKLRKFKTYMGRSSVMAESLSEYMDVVKERIATVKKTVESLQKPNYYKEAFEGFEKPVFEDVPDDVKENWIDQLTIKQFNEELADVFPYIYKLVSEATRAKEIGLDEIMAEADDPCWKGYKQIGMKKKGGKEVPNCVPEEAQLEAAFEKAMGQFSEAEEETEEGIKGVLAGIALLGSLWGVNNHLAQQAYDASPQLQQLIQLHQQAEAKGDEKKADELEQRIENHKARLDLGKGDVMGKDGKPIDIKDDDDTMDVKINSKGQMMKADAEEEKKTPLGEFILSYYDRETGEFPKGETAVLTMVEKDYGEEFIEPAKAFIEQVNRTFVEYKQAEAQTSPEFNRMRELAGLR